MLPDNEHMTYSDPEEIHECLERQVDFNYSWWLFKVKSQQRWVDLTEESPVNFT